MPASLPGNPLYCFAPMSDADGEPPQIRILIEGLAFAIPTALVALSHVDGLVLADRLNRALGLDRDACKCWPWHHLFAPGVLMKKELEAFSIDGGDFVQFVSIRQPHVPLVRVGKAMEPPDGSRWNAPTIDDLNGDTEREFDWAGVRNTTGEDLARLESGTEAESEVTQSDGHRLRELGIRRMMVLDVRDDPEPGTHRERRGR